MTKYSTIMAIDAQGAIGRGNQMLVHLPGDLKYFKATTSNRTVIMGRKTYESLPNGALPHRRNVVLTRRKGNFPNCELARSLSDALAMTSNEDEVFFIGGGQIYRDVMEVVDTLYITRIHYTFADAEVFFPVIDLEMWNLVWS